MNMNVRIAKELMRIAKELAADNGGDADMDALRKKFENFTLGGKSADEIAKNADEWKKLCDEWKSKYPDELPPAPGSVKI